MVSIEPGTSSSPPFRDAVAWAIEIAEKVKHRQKRVHLPAATLQKNVVHFPLWPEPTRGTPNVWLRGALFAAIQGKERRALKRELLAMVDGLEIRFTGWQLDQSDMDVWETIVHLSRLQAMGERVEFTAHAILKELKRDTGKSQYEWLKDVMARLYSAGVEITAGRFTYFGTLLKGARDELTGRYAVELESKLLTLYEAGWTQIEWNVRYALRCKPLALWLHGWYCSHAKPYPLKLETLRKLSGSRNSQLASFRRQLCKAMDDLLDIDAVKAWELRGDVVHVTRSPTPTQRKHLDKKSASGRKRKAKGTAYGAQ